jgi:hypothetical protein
MNGTRWKARRSIPPYQSLVSDTWTPDPADPARSPAIVRKDSCPELAATPHFTMKIKNWDVIDLDSTSGLVSAGLRLLTIGKFFVQSILATLFALSVATAAVFSIVLIFSSRDPQPSWVYLQYLFPPLLLFLIIFSNTLFKLTFQRNAVAAAVLTIFISLLLAVGLYGLPEMIWSDGRTPLAPASAITLAVVASGTVLAICGLILLLVARPSALGNDFSARGAEHKQSAAFVGRGRLKPLALAILKAAAISFAGPAVLLLTFVCVLIAGVLIEIRLFGALPQDFDERRIITAAVCSAAVAIFLATSLSIVRLLRSHVPQHTDGLIVVVGTVCLVLIGSDLSTLARSLAACTPQSCKPIVPMDFAEASLLWVTWQAFAFGNTVSSPLRRARSIVRNALLQSASEVLARSSLPPVLYLRSFSEEEQKIVPDLRALTHPLSLDHIHVRIEDVVCEVISAVGPLIAFQNPLSPRLLPGASREIVRDGDWQPLVSEYLQRSQLVVCLVGTSPGITWELRRIIALGLQDRVILVFPPAGLPGAASGPLLELLQWPDRELPPADLIRAAAYDTAVGRFALVVSSRIDSLAYVEALQICLKRIAPQSFGAAHPCDARPDDSPPDGVGLDGVRPLT